MPDLPAVRRNVADLRQLLIDPSGWGLSGPQCVALSDVDLVVYLLLPPWLIAASAAVASRSTTREPRLAGV